MSARAHTVWKTGWHNTGSFWRVTNVGLLLGTQFVWWVDGSTLRLGAVRGRV